MFVQTVTPNLTPNMDGLRSWAGYCLMWVQRSVNAPWAGSTAWQSWTQKTSFRHPDKLIPRDVWVPVWFSHWGTYGGTYDNFGHVAWYYNGAIYSSPLNHKAGYDVWGSIEEVERLYRCTYQGWSEDIAGMRVISQVAGTQTNTGGGDMITWNDVGGVRVINSEVEGYPLHETHAGAYDQVEMRAWVGQPWTMLIDQKWRQGEAFRTARQAKSDFYDMWANKVGELSARPTKAELEALSLQLKDQSAKVAEAEKKLAEELARPPQVVVEEKVITQNVSVPLTWKTVLPWIVSQVKGIKK